jgi:hypothetical protein
MLHTIIDIVTRWKLYFKSELIVAHVGVFADVSEVIGNIKFIYLSIKK